MIQIEGFFGHISTAFELVATFQEHEIARSRPPVGSWYLLACIDGEPIVVTGPVSVESRTDREAFREQTPQLHQLCWRAVVVDDAPGITIEFNGRNIRRGPHLDRKERIAAMALEYEESMA